MLNNFIEGVVKINNIKLNVAALTYMTDSLNYVQLESLLGKFPIF
jgi:hypothetical protein